jgi:L-ribulokinase
VPERPITSLGSAIFAFLAAGVFATIEEAQGALCPPLRAVNPDPAEHAVYDRLYALYHPLYFSMGAPGSAAVPVGHILPTLRGLAEQVRTGKRGGA